MYKAQFFLLLSPTQFPIILLGFLFLLGSHLLNYYPWIFVLGAMFIINWKQIKRWETSFVFTFVLSLFITWYILDPNIIFNTMLLGQIALTFIMYMVGLSVPMVNQKESAISIEKKLFYFLFIFFIAYVFSIIYSYIFITQHNPINHLGMHVCFNNEYKRTQVHGGLLISTIITYYLTFIAVLLPFILLFFKTFKKNGFHYLELIFLLGVSLFTIFLTAQMGRRTTIVLLVVVLAYLLIYKVIEHRKKINLKITFFISIMLLILLSAGYYFLEDTTAIQRLISNGFQDRRFGLWTLGLQTMLDYPFGGGYDIVLENFSKLAHNTWVDIGKDFGVIPFILFLFLSFIFVYHIIRMLFNTKITIFIKYIVIMISIVLFSILMIEPVFNSDKTFFSYTMFLLGVLIALNTKEKSIT